MMAITTRSSMSVKPAGPRICLRRKIHDYTPLDANAGSRAMEELPGTEGRHRGSRFDWLPPQGLGFRGAAWHPRGELHASRLRLSGRRERCESTERDSIDPASCRAPPGRHRDRQHQSRRQETADSGHRNTGTIMVHLPARQASVATHAATELRIPIAATGTASRSARDGERHPIPHLSRSQLPIAICVPSVQTQMRRCRDLARRGVRSKVSWSEGIRRRAACRLSRRTDRE